MCQDNRLHLRSNFHTTASTTIRWKDRTGDFCGGDISAHLSTSSSCLAEASDASRRDEPEGTPRPGDQQTCPRIEIREPAINTITRGGEVGVKYHFPTRSRTNWRRPCAGLLLHDGHLPILSHNDRVTEPRQETETEANPEENAHAEDNRAQASKPESKRRL